MTAPNAPSVRHSMHPYYASDGCYYWSGSSGAAYPHTEHASWADFLADMGSADLDLNLLYRWDWRQNDPDDYEPGAQEASVEHLELFYMQQRKAGPWSHRVVVTAEDEPAVRAWLLDRAVHMARLWSPLLDEPLPQWERDLLEGVDPTPSARPDEPDAVSRDEARARLGALPAEAVVEIRSDGLAYTSEVRIGDQPIYGVQRVQLDIDSHTGLATAVLHLDGVRVRWAASMHREEAPGDNT